MFDLYQVQMETDTTTYSIEVATNDCDAEELAEIYLAITYDDYGPFHVGGYCHIGGSEKEGVIRCRRNYYG